MNGEERGGRGYDLSVRRGGLDLGPCLWWEAIILELNAGDVERVPDRFGPAAKRKVLKSQLWQASITSSEYMGQCMCVCAYVRVSASDKDSTCEDSV